MTLRTQLASIITALFLLLFAGQSIIGVDHLRQYLDRQMQSHASDTAAALGLSLAPYLQKSELIAAGSIVDTLFERGDYREISVETQSGAPLVKRIRPSHAQGVPQWFVDLVPLDTPQGEARVKITNNGFALIRVRGNPGYAYQELWEISLDQLSWFGIVFFAMLIGGLTAIHFMLISLHEVENQAIGIISREYPVVNKLPRTRELAQVVSVMNRISIRVAQMFREQLELTERLRAEAYLDPVTNLGNRRYFIAQLEHLIRSPDEFYRGALLLIALKGFRKLNDREGFGSGDAALQSTARAVKAVADELRGSIVARLSGASFALLAPTVEAADAARIAERLLDLLRLEFPNGIDSGETAHVGIAPFLKGMQPGELLSAADMALCSAQQAGPLGWNLFQGEITAQPPRGTEYWRKLFQSVISEKRIQLQFQPVFGIIQAATIQHEVFIRIRDEQGEILNAAQFMPIAEIHGFAPALDRIAVENTLRLLEKSDNHYAVNLSINSILDAAFLAWLQNELAKSGARARRLSFELQEYDIARNMASVREFSGLLTLYGSELGVDHCGRGFVSFGYMSQIRIGYLKIDGSYIRDINLAKDHQFLVQSIARIAHELDIRVIAESVETVDERAALSTLYMDALQGHLIGKPLDFPQPSPKSNAIDLARLAAQ